MLLYLLVKFLFMDKNQHQSKKNLLIVLVIVALLVWGLVRDLKKRVPKEIRYAVTEAMNNHYGPNVAPEGTDTEEEIIDFISKRMEDTYGSQSETTPKTEEEIQNFISDEIRRYYESNPSNQ